MRNLRFSSALLVLALLAATPAAHAQRPDRAFSIEAALQRVALDSPTLGDDDGFAPAVRASYRFSERWALEGQAAESELVTSGIFAAPPIDPEILALYAPIIGFGDLELQTVDLSARYRLAERGRFALFTLGGVGWLDLALPATGLLAGDDVFTQHLGVASEIALGKRVFLRPDVRYRWSDDVQLRIRDGVILIPEPNDLPRRIDADLGLDLEAGLSVGWRI